MNKDMESFNTAAKSYDNEMRTERAKAIADEIRSHINNGLEKSAIEYGCGTGLVGLQLANEFQTLLLVDYSAGMLKQADMKINDMNYSSVSTLCCDFLQGVPNGLKADYIFSSLALHHVADAESIMNCFYNILNPGGRLLIVDINKGGDDFHAKYPDFNGHKGFEHSYLKELAVKTKFSGANVKTFYHGVKIAKGREISYSLFIFEAVKE